MTPILSVNHLRLEEALYHTRDCQLSGVSFPTEDNVIEIAGELPISQANDYSTNSPSSNLDARRNYFEDPPLPTLQAQMERTHISGPTCNYVAAENHFSPSRVYHEEAPMSFFTTGADNCSQFGETAWQQPCVRKPALSFVEQTDLASNFNPGSDQGYYQDATADQPTTDDTFHCNSMMEIHLAIASPSPSDHPPLVIDLISSGSSEDGERDGTDENLPSYEERAFHEPYAKLIYRALLGAPNNSMFLHEIYQWFIDHTDKGSSPSSGWRNSIRHNLSMNAAFRKSDQIPPGEDSKRSSEWVLEPFAIKNGVTPTTRYRKNTKKPIRSSNPASACVRSRRTGGLRMWKASRRRPKVQKNERKIILKTTTNYETEPPHFQHPTMASTHYNMYPPHVAVADDFENLYYPEVICDTSLSFRDIKGVHMDDEPLFCKNNREQFDDVFNYKMGRS